MSDKKMALYQRITSLSGKSKTIGAEVRLGFSRGCSEIRGLTSRG